MSNSSTETDLTKRRIIATALSVIALLAVLAFTWWIDGQGGPDETAAAASSTATAPLADGAANTAPGTTPSADTTRKPSPRPSARKSTAPKKQNGSVPARVADTLEQIDSGRWPEAANAPGTHGGDTFRNREGNLPTKSANGKRITYKEWDVNPKKRGQGRDAERIVTGSDGSAWYTLDHYQTFTQIRGPSA
ncbi:ribonuclease domain-containing protein [Gordonia phthalatica]|uniref:Ribonuclease N1 n=1 Tax=Gordonia phthalatica TaxID=1136941 RepID=A0A0N9NE72_9ACTN|nr:ribonuclease domain-containing protein [Gordonia phthalatica]ALG83554.1 ribonuclease N1 [Gordonia phthalatica]